METLVKALGAVVLVMALMIFIAALMAFPIKWLWNDVVVSIFHLRSITAFEAWELMVLGGFLFKSSTSIKSKED